MEQNSSSDLYLDELSVWRIIRLDGWLVYSMNSGNLYLVAKDENVRASNNIDRDE